MYVCIYVCRAISVSVGEERKKGKVRQSHQGAINRSTLLQLAGCSTRSWGGKARQGKAKAKARFSGSPSGVEYRTVAAPVDLFFFLLIIFLLIYVDNDGNGILIRHGKFSKSC